ncbi:hypothetical protein C4K04_2707 [Pseudomonas chlororaphis]|uniref:Uncharacterized protein n=1 Tax=Pseudomonas chlororaphis TaxID=587753 RepID=A0A3G7TQ34_9PSED|nr:hypothetical protein [Pseudomonas chlororaphis]AZE48379.1 hypothetical protein C4K04_2707 [Pseudomonas chlororaphis]
MASVSTITPASGVSISLVQFNSVVEGEGFYVSHNDYDAAIYGGETTALVFGQMQAFYILNGDHRDAYSALVPAGFDACMAYFNANIELANKHSERPAQAI